MPPRTWASLWCSPMVVLPSAQPASQAPYSARDRADRSSGPATTAGQRAGQGPQRLGRHGRQQARGVGCVQRLDGVRQRVHAAGGAHVGWQRDRERRVVDDDAGQHAHVAPGGLALRVGQAPDGSHLAAGVRGRHSHDRQAGLQRHRLGQPRRRAAPDRDEHPGTQLAGPGDGPGGELDRHVLGHVAQPPDQVPGQLGTDHVGSVVLVRAGDQQRRYAERAGLLRDPVQGADAEDDPDGPAAEDGRVVGEPAPLGRVGQLRQPGHCVSSVVVASVSGIRPRRWRASPTPGSRPARWPSPSARRSR